MCPKSQKQSIIEQVLGGQEPFECLPPSYLAASRYPELKEVKWRPIYLYRAGGRLLGVDVFYGDRVPALCIENMRLARERLQDLDVAFLVPEGQDFNVIREACHENEVDIIAKMGGAFVRLSYQVLGTYDATGDKVQTRIPAWLLTPIRQLRRLEDGFRKVLCAFAEGYANPQHDDGDGEEQQLSAVFLSLMGTDSRFAARYEPLSTLRWFERQFQQVGWRDHFFHSFINFLLGCVVIDQAYDVFTQSVNECFPGSPDLSIEYAWLLTALFHDVGYPTERRRAIGIYGDEDLTRPGETEPAVLIQERRTHWKDGLGFECARSQLVSLYEHLSQPQITNDWSADPFMRKGDHPLVTAMRSSYVSEGSHGVASALGMLAQIQSLASDAPDPARQFLCKHIYLAGLSILFHDWKFRKACRDSGIGRIGSRRFPLAVLLMVLDSVQDDRREEEPTYVRPDALQGLEVSGDMVSLNVNLEHFSIPELYSKVQEVSDILRFVSFDGLRYRYPPALTVTPDGVSR